MKKNHVLTPSKSGYRLNAEDTGAGTSGGVLTPSKSGYRLNWEFLLMLQQKAS